MIQGRCKWWMENICYCPPVWAMPFVSALTRREPVLETYRP